MAETQVKTKAKARVKKAKIAKSEPIAIRLTLAEAALLDQAAVELFAGDRAKTIGHALRVAFSGLDAPKPPRNRLGKMPKP